MEVIVFNKTKEDRLKEFQDVFSASSKLVASAIAAHWSFHLELTLEPLGWQALWKIPRHECYELNLKFPTVVLVEVTSVDFKEFKAWVRILKVFGPVDIQSEHEVDLKNLHPTQDQENAVDAVGTANVLDQLRFFYNHLWRSWDCDESENEDWPCTYLEARLQLYYDIQQGRLSRGTAERISKLIIEGREIYSQIKELESELDEETSAEDVVDESLADCAEAASTLPQLHIRLEPIKTELRILENPAMRKLLEKRVAQIENRKPEKYVVWNGQSVEKCIEFLQAVEKICGSETVAKPVHSLQAGLDLARAGDTLILSSGTHYVNGSGRLEEGGTLCGIDEALSAVVRSPKAGNFLLDVCVGTLSLQNVRVDAQNADIGFVVRPKGTLELTNVQLKSSKCTVGVVVLPGGHLRVEKCELTDLQVGVHCHPGGSISISDSRIHDCSVGLQVKAFGGSEVKLENLDLSDCNHVAIDVEDLSVSATGSVNILRDLAGFSYSNVEIRSCKDEVVVQQYRSVLTGGEPGSAC